MYWAGPRLELVVMSIPQHRLCKPSKPLVRTQGSVSYKVHFFHHLPYGVNVKVIESYNIYYTQTRDWHKDEILVSLGIETCQIENLESIQVVFKSGIILVNLSDNI